MSIQVVADWKNFDYHKVRKLLGDMTIFFSRLGQETIKQIGRNFEQEGALWGKWAPLAPGTTLGRRQGRSSKILAASGRLRASFRYEAFKSFVRVGSPLKLAAWHHEGRGSKAGKKDWEIKPVRRKALAFPAPAGAGGRSLLSRYGGVSVARGNQIQHLGKKGGGKTIEFKTYGYLKRSKGFIGNVPMVVRKSVTHTGYPPRPLLPTNLQAGEIAKKVAHATIQMILNKGVP